MKAALVAALPYRHPVPMVKHPLTQIAYWLGVSARFVPPHCDRAREFAARLGTSGHLGRITTNPQQRPPLGRGSQGAAARDCGGVLLSAAQDHPGPVHAP